MNRWKEGKWRDVKGRLKSLDNCTACVLQTLVVCGLSLQITSVHEAVVLVRTRVACLLWTKHYCLCQPSKFISCTDIFKTQNS